MAKRNYKKEPTILCRENYTELDMHRIIYNLLSEGSTNLESLNEGLSSIFPEYCNTDIFKISYKPPKTLEGYIIEIKYNDGNVKRMIQQIKNKESAIKDKFMEKVYGMDESLKKDGLECIVKSILMHNNPSKKLSEECKKNNIELIKYSEPTIYFEKY